MTEAVNGRSEDGAATLRVSLEAALAQARMAMLLTRSGMPPEAIERLVESNLRGIAREGL